MFGPEALLVGAVIGVGILHTIVPDHWVPIALIARQQGWSRRETAQVALKAGTGHVVSTLLIGLIVWIAGVAFATRFGNAVSLVSSYALIAFGGWIAYSSLRDLRTHAGHGHSHGHAHGHERHGRHPRGPEPAFSDGRPAIHGSERARIVTDHGLLDVSIYEDGSAPRFRLTGTASALVSVETVRADGSRQTFDFIDRGEYWESLNEIPEPHIFTVTVSVRNEGDARWYTAEFSEHSHGHSHGHPHGEIHEDADAPYAMDRPADPIDELYKPTGGGVSVLAKHVHAHRHRNGPAHVHLHDHGPDSWHPLRSEPDAEPPVHDHGHKRPARTALLLILGSSPMIEGLPAFFAAARYGLALIAVMAVAFGLSTIATYVALCVYSTAGLQRVSLGSFEKYGEVISGAFIALVGVVFLIFPVL